MSRKPQSSDLPRSSTDEIDEFILFAFEIIGVVGTKWMTGFIFLSSLAMGWRSFSESDGEL